MPLQTFVAKNDARQLRINWRPAIGRSVAVLLLVIFAVGCKGDSPTAPTAVPRSSTGETFGVTGVVIDEQGLPVVGAEVTMAHWLGGFARRPSVRTDASGGYTIGFTSNPWTDGITGNRGAARAEVVADGYDWYWRTVVATTPPLVENFRLRRIQRVTAGDSIVVSVTPDNGDCTGWLANPCGRFRVAVPVSGNLTVDAIPTQTPAGFPELEVCCVSGNELYGNPVTLPVQAGSETWVQIGQQRTGFTRSLSFVVKTSLDSF